MIDVLLTTTTFVAAALAKRHRRSRGKVRPCDRDRRSARYRTDVRRNAAHGRLVMYANALARLPLCPFAVTVTVTAPALPAGVVAVIVVLFTTTTLVAAALPNVTVAPAAKFVPVMVTAVPPATGPWFGVTLLTVGCTTYVKPFVKLPICEPDIGHRHGHGTGTLRRSRSCDLRRTYHHDVGCSRSSERHRRARRKVRSRDRYRRPARHRTAVWTDTANRRWRDVGKCTRQAAALSSGIGYRDGHGTGAHCRLELWP